MKHSDTFVLDKCEINVDNFFWLWTPRRFTQTENVKKC